MNPPKGVVSNTKRGHSTSREMEDEGWVFSRNTQSWDHSPLKFLSLDCKDLVESGRNVAYFLNTKFDGVASQTPRSQEESPWPYRIFLESKVVKREVVVNTSLVMLTF